MPGFKDPNSPEHGYFAKVFYQQVPQPVGSENEEHWYYFCFQDSVNWLDNSQGAVNQKKLETIGELASGVAHDFNNLIMGIQSNAEAMLTQPSLTPQARDSLVNIIRACSTGASLTRSLLGYAKKQPLTMTPFNLVDMIHDVARIAGVVTRQSSHRARQGFPGEERPHRRRRLLLEPEPLPPQPDQERPRSHARGRHYPRHLGGLGH